MDELHERVRNVLVSNGIKANTFIHAEMQQDIKSPKDFATAIGYSPDRIAKTVFVAERGISSEIRWHDLSHFGAVCLPSPFKMNLKAVAVEFGWKACEMAKSDELKKVLDYPSLGVSPLGLGDIRLIIDRHLFSFSTIIVGGGKIGVELEISPKTLASLTASSLQTISISETSR